jgi:hypothetical protein
MPKKLSDQQENVSVFFDEIATKLDHDGGLLMGQDLSPAEKKTAVRELRGLAKEYFERARKNRSVGS